MLSAPLAPMLFPVVCELMMMNGVFAEITHLRCTVFEETELFKKTRLLKHLKSDVRDFIKHNSSPSTHTQQPTKLETMVLRALQELFNQTRLFKHWTSAVRDFKTHHSSPSTHTQQPTKLETMVLRALQ